MLSKAIILLLGSAAADRYQVKLDGPCDDPNGYEKLIPLLLSANKPLEDPGCMDNGPNHKYSFEKPADVCNEHYKLEIHENDNTVTP
jgi:hypothetical protein